MTRLRLTPAQLSALACEEPERHEIGAYGDDALDLGMIALGSAVRYAEGILVVPEDTVTRGLLLTALTHLSNVNSDIHAGLVPGFDREARGFAGRAARSLDAIARQLRGQA